MSVRAEVDTIHTYSGVFCLDLFILYWLSSDGSSLQYSKLIREQSWCTFKLESKELNMHLVKLGKV